MPTQLISPRQLAVAIGSSESSVKRWIDHGEIHASRTAGGHRRIALADAIEFIRRHGHPIVQPQAIGLAPPTVDAGDDALTEHLQAGHEPEVIGLIRGRYAAGASFEDLCDRSIRSAMERIGELWHERPEGVFVEHRATAICAAALHRLAEWIPVPAPDAPVAVGGALAGDPSWLPSLMASIGLGISGFRAIDLGPNTPESALSAAIRRHRPRIVWLSINHLPDASLAASEIDRLRRSVEEADAMLVLGGRAAREIEVPAHPRVVRVDSIRELRWHAEGAQAQAPRSASG